jgi:catalase
MSLNTNQLDPRQHPLKATAMAIGAGLQGEFRGPRASHMQGANEGPADVIAKVSGCVPGGKREDDSLYFTNNEGIPLPDPAHSKTVGGIPVASDVFLFQKQQHFNRSKPLERTSRLGTRFLRFELQTNNLLSSCRHGAPLRIRRLRLL